MVREPLAADLPVGAVVAPGMDQLNPVGVGYSQRGGVGQEVLGSRGMGSEEERARGQGREPVAIIVHEPAIAGARGGVLECSEQAEGDDLTGKELGLGDAWEGPRSRYQPA